MRILPLLAVLLLAGCQTREDPRPPLVNVEDSMLYLDPGLRPEVLLFPEYFLMEGFELNQHGRIPQTSLIGGGMRAKLGLRTVRNRFGDALDAHGWTVDKMEIGKQSFRLTASFKEEEVEIRGVQGRGATQVFILYQPEVLPLMAEQMQEPLGASRRVVRPWNR